MGPQLPTSCGFARDPAKHAVLSIEPGAVSNDQVVALAIVRLVLDGREPLARLSVEQQFWQRYYLNIREQAMVRVSELSALLQPCRLVEALELGDGSKIVWEGLGQTRVRLVQALSPLLLEQLGQAKVKWQGSEYLASSFIREWTGVEYADFVQSVRWISCNAPIAHVTANGLWRDISAMKPQPGPSTLFKEFGHLEQQGHGAGPGSKTSAMTASTPCPLNGCAALRTIFARGLQRSLRRLLTATRGIAR